MGCSPPGGPTPAHQGVPPHPSTTVVGWGGTPCPAGGRGLRCAVSAPTGMRQMSWYLPSEIALAPAARPDTTRHHWSVDHRRLCCVCAACYLRILQQLHAMSGKVSSGVHVHAKSQRVSRQRVRKSQNGASGVSLSTQPPRVRHAFPRRGPSAASAPNRRPLRCHAGGITLPRCKHIPSKKDRCGRSLSE